MSGRVNGTTVVSHLQTDDVSGETVKARGANTERHVDQKKGRRLSPKIGLGTAGTGLACVLTIIIVFGTFRQVSAELLNYGFQSTRELHSMLRDVAHLGDSVTAARLAPTHPESLYQLAKATDLAYVSFIRQDRSATLKHIPQYEPAIEEMERIVRDLDEIKAAGQPFDTDALQFVENDLVAIEKQMNESYYAFGERIGIELIALGRRVVLLGWQIAALLVAFSVVTIGAVLLVINRRETLREMRHLASHDLATGVRNRVWLSLHGDRLLAEARRLDRRVDIALFDLDHFKSINDSFGHHVGDQVLEHIGKILLETAQEAEVEVARIGGDEFALAISSPFDQDNTTLISGLMERLNQYAQFGPHRLRVGASCGIASFPGDASDLETLLKYADHATYAAKAQGRGLIVRFTDRILAQVKRNANMEARLKSALAGNELFLEWQLQYELRTGCVSGVEALLRWNDPKDGQPISPAEFIPIAEKSDLIIALDRYVVNRACAEAALLRAVAPNLTFSVNLSGKSFGDPGLSAVIKNALEENGLPGSSLELEITEGVFVGNSPLVKSMLEEIAESGVGVAIDDFGTGYSNLAYLAELSIDRFKIDRSFINGLENATKKQKLVLSILALGRSLEITAVAEGVENDAQMRFLIDSECEFAQGYHLSVPLSTQRLHDYLRVVSGADSGQRQEDGSNCSHGSTA
jgi:diguanylate cyclase (GGDEF)-like protein